VCVYLFVVFYSFGWGPIPFVLSAECAVSEQCLINLLVEVKTDDANSPTMFDRLRWLLLL
jgi:hypothetical protein